MTAGTVRIALGRDDGKVLQCGPWRGASDTTNPLSPIELVVDVPSGDGQGYGGTDSAHSYNALLELSPGAKVVVYAMEVCRT